MAEDETKEQQVEPSLTAALAKMMENEKHHDITLKGTDEVLIGANRAMLAERSDVFEAMLSRSGSFKEATTDVVELGYTGEILQAIVEHIATDTISVLDESFKGNGKSERKDEDAISLLLSLWGAAIYFSLPSLAKKARDILQVFLAFNPSLKFLCLELCNAGRMPLEDVLFEFVMTQVRSATGGTTARVGNLSFFTMKEILRDEKLMMTELELFQMLQVWVDADCVNRKEAAKELLSSHINLEKIEPSVLSNVVRSSGLVTEQQLSIVFEKQAHDFCNAPPSSILGQPRQPWPVPVTYWDHSTDLSPATGWCMPYDVYRCPAMKSGVFQWSIKVEGADTKKESIGIVSADAGVKSPIIVGSSSLTDTKHGWVFTHDGSVYHNEELLPRKAFPFGCGTLINFVLDLRPNQEGNGTLSCSEGSSEDWYQIFSNLLKDLGQGFVPAVGTRVEKGFRLMSIRKVAD